MRREHSCQMSAERIVYFHPLLISNAVVLNYSNVDYDNNVDYDTCKEYVLQIMLMSELIILGPNSS